MYVEAILNKLAMCRGEEIRDRKTLVSPEMGSAPSLPLTAVFGLYFNVRGSE